MRFPDCKHFESSGGRDGFCTKGDRKIQLLKADSRPCPNICDPAVSDSPTETGDSTAQAEEKAPPKKKKKKAARKKKKIDK